MRCRLPSLAALGAAWLLAGCSSHGADGTTGEAPAPPPSGSHDRPGPWAEESAPAPPAPPPRPTRVGVQHILVAWKGAENAPKTVTRSKEDAQKRADEALKKVDEPGKSFADLVKEYSDDPVSKKYDGQIGNIEEWVMPEAFFNAATALPVGAHSGVVETPRGFHIIVRTK